MWNLKPNPSISGTVLNHSLLIMSYTLDGSLPVHNPITSFINHLENTSSLNNVELPNFDIFHYTVFLKIYSFISPPIPKEKGLSIGKLSSSLW